MTSSVLSERAVERWQEVRFGRVRRMCQIFVSYGSISWCS